MQAMKSQSAKMPQRRFGDPLQVRKRQRIPLPQGTHESYGSAWGLLLVVLLSTAVVVGIVATVYIAVFGIPTANACGDAYQNQPHPVKIMPGPAA